MQVEGLLSWVHCAFYESAFSLVGELFRAICLSAGLAYDWIREMLLWSHQGPDNKIYTLAQNHTQPMVIYSSLDNPAYLTMDSHRGCVSADTVNYGEVVVGMGLL